MRKWAIPLSHIDPGRRLVSRDPEGDGRVLVETHNGVVAETERRPALVLDADRIAGTEPVTRGRKRPLRLAGSSDLDDSRYRDHGRHPVLADRSASDRGEEQQQQNQARSNGPYVASIRNRLSGCDFWGTGAGNSRQLSNCLPHGDTDSGMPARSTVGAGRGDHVHGRDIAPATGTLSRGAGACARAHARRVCAEGMRGVARRCSGTASRSAQSHLVPMRNSGSQGSLGSRARLSEQALR